MANINTEILVNVSLGAPAVGQAGFGIPLFVATAGSLGVGFTERIRFYTSAEDAIADTDLTASAQAAVDAAFSQPRHVATVAVGRIEADAAQVLELDYTGTPEVGDVMDVTINGVLTSYVVASAVLSTEVAALRGAMVAALAAEAVTVGGAADQITVTADVAGDAFTYSSSITLVGVGDLANTETESTPNTSIATELAAINAESNNWYGFCEESRTATNILRAAAAAETLKKLFVAQSDDADILTAVTTDILSQLGALNYKRTALAYKGSDTAYAAMAWLGLKLEADPDVQTTIWKYANLVGISADVLTSTEIANVRGKDGNVFVPFYDVDSMADGVLVDGNPIDILITMDWLDARSAERIAQRFLDVSNNNSKIPYNDAGLQQLRAIVEGVFRDGVTALHFSQATTDDGQETPLVTAPAIGDVPSADKINRRARIGFLAELAGALEKTTVSGNVVIDL